MPLRRAACSSFSPSAASIVRSSIVSSMTLPSSFQAPAVHGPAVLHEVFELGSKLFEEAQHRHRGGIAQRAQRVAENAFGDALQIVEVRALSLSGHDALDDAVHPRGALAARRALSARFVAIDAC